LIAASISRTEIIAITRNRLGFVSELHDPVVVDPVTGLLQLNIQTGAQAAVKLLGAASIDILVLEAFDRVPAAAPGALEPLPCVSRGRRRFGRYRTD